MAYYHTWRVARRRRSPLEREASQHAGMGRVFGQAVDEVKTAFFAFDQDNLDLLLARYGTAHGKKAEKYARATFPKWKSRAVILSGVTMQRLIELVPRYLSANARAEILSMIVDRNRKPTPVSRLRVNVMDPRAGLAELRRSIEGSGSEDLLAYLPPVVMHYAKWLYDDDIVAARAVMREMTRRRDEILIGSARKELDLFERTINSKQVETASYTFETSSKKIAVQAYTPGILSRLFAYTRSI